MESPRSQTLPRVQALLLADTHLGFDDPVRPKVVRRRRGPDFFDNYRRTLERARAGDVDFVIHGGDLFANPRVPAAIVDRAYREILELADGGVPFIIAPGNHERSRLPSSLLLGHPNVYVFDTPRTFCIAVRGTRIAIAGFPFVRRDLRQRFPEIVSDTQYAQTDAEIRLLCVHQAIEGAQVGPQNYTFRTGRDVIRWADIPETFDAVVAGHIHRHQILTRRRNDGSWLPVIYPGSTERTSFAEKAETKGFCELTMQQSSSGRWKLATPAFVALPIRPMVDIELGGDITRSTLQPFLNQEIADLDPNAVVRLRGPHVHDEDVRRQLTSETLRELFPATVNVQLCRSLYRSHDDTTR